MATKLIHLDEDKAQTHRQRVDQRKKDSTLQNQVAPLTSPQILISNTALQRLLARRATAAPFDLDDATAGRIHRARSGGHALDGAVQAQMGARPAPKLPSADELVSRIVNCIGVWETNRGGTNPAPRESTLDTVAGVPASMATVEQATMPYAITVLKRHKELWDKANPPLTLSELNDADERCRAVAKLITSVDDADANHETPEKFTQRNQAAISATGLNNEDVKTMFSAVTLRRTLQAMGVSAEEEGRQAKGLAMERKDTAKKQAIAEKTAKHRAVKKAIDAIPVDDRLGLGKGSLQTYINRPGAWGENRAGWQRKAVASMPGDVASRIKAVAVSNNGKALAISTVTASVNHELEKKLVPSLQEIVISVAQKNNPNEKNYGMNVWRTYTRIFPSS